MNILAFDTSSAACTVALLNNGNEHYLHQIAPLAHGQLILKMIDTLLSEQGMQFTDLDALAYGVGPGSFTGMRIATSVAQGIGFVTKLPLIPISSLAILAQTIYLEQQWPKVLVAVDARMNQIYWAAYHVKQTACVELQGNEQVLNAIDFPILTIENKGLEWIGVGDAWRQYPLAADKLRLHALYPDCLPNAKALLALAKIKFMEQAWIYAADAAPNYLR